MSRRMDNRGINFLVEKERKKEGKKKKMRGDSFCNSRTCTGNSIRRCMEQGKKILYQQDVVYSRISAAKRTIRETLNSLQLHYD